MADRLRKAREARGLVSAAEAARGLDIPYATYAGHENGSRGFLDDIDRYAHFFGVRPEWLRSGSGTMRRNRTEFDILFDNLSVQQRQQVMDFIRFLAKQNDAGISTTLVPESARRNNTQ